MYEGFGEMMALVMRLFMFIYVQAWPIGAGIIVWSLVSGATQSNFLAAVAGIAAFGAAVVFRFFHRFPSAWPGWKRHFQIMLIRKVVD